mgnify:FL=1
MSERITQKHLDGMVSRLNRLTNSPQTYMSEIDGKRVINIGHFHIDSAYGGVNLVRTCTNGGGISTPIGGGFCTKRELYDKIYSYIRGIELMQEGE